MSDVIVKSEAVQTKKQLHIPGVLFDKMKRATELCQIEMSMLGLLKRHRLGLVLEELWIPPQIVGASHAQISPDMIGAIQTELFTSGRIQPGDEDSFLRFAWHSHVDMHAHMSTPDRQCFNGLGGEGTPYDPDWFISMVMNRRGDYEVVYDQFQPIRTVTVLTPGVEVVVGDPTFEDPTLVEAIKANVRRGKQTYVGAGRA